MGDDSTVVKTAEVVKYTRPKPPNAGKGRQKGVPNKVTGVARQMFAALLENNLANAQTWLDEVAKKDKRAALQILLDLAEYSIPKLSRTELTGADGQDLIPTLRPDDENL
jgi:hypothetical protein